MHEAVIDLAAGRLTGWQAVTGGPALLLGETTGAADIALSDSRMVLALAKRGFSRDQVLCLPLTAGNFGSKEEQGRRLLKVPCVGKPTGSNYWARPIEGLFATVDLKDSKVLDVTDKSWSWRTYMDSGEYGFGNFLSPLRKGVDCPSYARFLSGIMPQDNGEPIAMPDAICIFERSIRRSRLAAL